MRYSLKYTILTWALFFSAATATTINVPADYSTIQAALTAADSSDTVLVQPSTYYENIFWPDVNGIKLISAGDSSNTVIDGGGISSVIYMNPVNVTIDTTTVIQGFKITNGGNVQFGGGIYCRNASLSLKEILVAGNSVTGFEASGGGIYFQNSNAHLAYSTIRYNIAQLGGGICLRDSSNAFLISLNIYNNTGTMSGGGIYCTLSSPVMQEVNVSKNTGDGLVSKASSPFISDSKFSNNFGRGLSFHTDIDIDNSGDSYPNLSNIEVIDNQDRGLYCYRVGDVVLLLNLAQATISGNLGGGLFLGNLDSNSEIKNVTINDNSGLDGGGVDIYYSNLSLTNIFIYENVASRYGGGINCEGADPVIINSKIVGNSATYGGGISCDVSSLQLAEIQILENSAEYGGGIYLRDNSNINLLKCLLAENTSSNVGEGLYATFSSLPILISNNILNNGFGVFNTDNTITIQATNNWWGHSSGPYQPIQNPNGLGDSVNAFVNITPWLTEPDKAAPPIPVQNLTIDSTGTDFIALSWDANPIGDLAGYKIYFDTDSSGFPYSDTIDVGNVTSYALGGLSPGLTYYIAATCYDTDGNESWYSKEVNATPIALAVEKVSDLPTSFALHPAYPNPFNPTTTIRFDLPNAVNISIVVYDLLGREVVRLMNGRLEAGYQQVVWEGRTAAGREVPSGIYIARLVTPEYTRSVKMLLLR